QLCRPLSAGDRFGCAVNPNAGDQELAGSRELASSAPNAIDFIEGKQDRFAGRTDDDVTTKMRAVIASQVFAKAVQRYRTVRSEGRGQRRKDSVVSHGQILAHCSEWAKVNKP